MKKAKTVFFVRSWSWNGAEYEPIASDYMTLSAAQKLFANSQVSSDTPQHDLIRATVDEYGLIDSALVKMKD